MTPRQIADSMSDVFRKYLVVTEVIKALFNHDRRPEVCFIVTATATMWT